MSNLKILEELFDKKKLAMLKFFLQNKDKEFYLRELSKETSIPIATAYRIIKKLMELDIIIQIKIKKFKLYKLNHGKDIDFLESFLKEGKRVIEEFIEKARQINNIQGIIMHGDETETKANMLIIGENIDSNDIKKICAETKEKYSFIITPLTLTREQFEQMSNMGLYSGKKRVLFSKA